MAPREPLSINGFMIYSRAMNKNKQQKTRRGSLRLTVQQVLLLTLVPGQPIFFSPENCFVFFSHRSSRCLPLLLATFLLPGKQKFLKSREKVRGLHRPGQEPPGLLPARSLQWAAAHPQGNPNKVTSPPESIFPFKERLCLEPKTYLCLEGDFIQPFTDTVCIKGAHPSPFAIALRGRLGLDPNKLQGHWIWLVINPFFVLSFLLLSPCPTQDFLCYGQPGLQSNQILSFQRWDNGKLFTRTI